ncbi:hypothetical protein RvY_03829 [Ramazzottius varieornatus]|uniref:Uncharacterized protein n=1 Tax=Ramazzottius varieornatus TaxID=947166 RepID=A0A1D1UPG4_RAMVA|nr:hypothetical protein RvY_03829 [Ramazzottius varieornatus]
MACNGIDARHPGSVSPYVLMRAGHKHSLHCKWNELAVSSPRSCEGQTRRELLVQNPGHVRREIVGQYKLWDRRTGGQNGGSAVEKYLIEPATRPPRDPKV